MALVLLQIKRSYITIYLHTYIFAPPLQSTPNTGGELNHEYGVKQISHATEIKNLYFDLLKSPKKEIMLILPTNNAFERHVLIGVIGLLRQIARGKNPPG